MNEAVVFFSAAVHSFINSLASSSMYDRLKGGLPGKVMKAIEQTQDDFIAVYQERFGSRENCFLSRQATYDKISQSIMNPFSEAIDINNIDEGYDVEPLTEEAKQFFITKLYENAAQDHELLQLIGLQGYIHDQRVFQAEMRSLKDKINQLVTEASKKGYIQCQPPFYLKSTQEASRLIADKYIKKAFAELSTNHFELFSNLFKNIVAFEGRPALTEQENIFEVSYNLVRDCKKTYPLNLKGLAGTGKSTFLSIFYQYLLNKSKNFDFIPIYIDLHYYIKSIDPNRIQEFQKDLDILFLPAKQINDADIIIIIDGVDKYFSTNIDFEHRLITYLNNLQVKKKIISFSEPSPMLKAKLKKRPRFNLNEASNILSFKSVDVTEVERLYKFIDAYVDTRPEKKGLKHILISKIKEFSLVEVDLNTLTILSYCQTKFGEVGSISELYERYCLAQLDSFEIESLIKVAELTFKYIILEERYDEEYICKNAKEWALFHKHKSFCNYLLAYYYIYCLSTFEESSPDPLLNVLYPKEINFFIKDILYNNYDCQKSVLEKIKKFYSRFEYRAQAQMCYLLGRITNEALKAEAKKFLETCYMKAQKDMDELKNDEIEKTRISFLYRTITISMVCLEGKDKCADYVDTLLRDSFFSQLNNGFHLEYYGDIEYDPNKDMLEHKDNGQVHIHNAFKALVNKIQKFYDDPGDSYESAMYEINLYTLCSLVQKRLGTSYVTDEEIETTLAHINNALAENSFSSKDLKPYLHMLKANIQNGRYKPENLYAYTYLAKEVPRKGWVDDVPELNRENIVEHMYYTWMLGMLYLPEKPPKELPKRLYKNYNKTKILNTILIHDIAEIDVGDKTPKEITDEHRIQEDLFMRIFLMHDTYDSISDLSEYKELWENYRDNKRTDINGKLAYELDKIQALYQFYVYSNNGVEFSKERKNEWRKEAEKIESALGKKILHMVIKDGIAPKKQ